MTNRFKIVGGLIGLGLVLLLGSSLAGHSAKQSVTPSMTLPTASAPQSNEAVITADNAVVADAPVNPTPEPKKYIVKEVVDGDTIKVDTDQGLATVRLIGVDTPETKDPRKPVQCFGQEASAKMKEWVEGKAVELQSDPTQGDKDKYQRLLRYVLLDGRLINQQLIEEGYGFEYTYNVPYKYQMEFKAAQKQAEAGQRGLWAPTACAGVTKTPSTTPSLAAPAANPPTTSPALAPAPAPAPIPATASGVVKKSQSDICHAPGTTYYDRTKNFTPFNTLQECLDSGGRLPNR